MKLPASNRNWKRAIFATGVLVMAGCIPDPEPELDDAASPGLDGGDYEEDDAGEGRNDAGGAADAARDASPLDAGQSDAALPLDTGVDASVSVDASADAASLDSAAPESDASDASAEATTPDASTPSVTGDTYGVSSNKRLVRFDRASGVVTFSADITGLSGEGILGVDVRPKDRTLYLLSSAGKLYTVDLTTAVATFKLSLSADASDTSAPFTALSGTDFGVDFNPVADRLRVVSSSGQNLRINVDTGATTTDAALNPSASGLSAAAYTNSFASACRTRLFVIDAAAAMLLLQDPPNDGKLSPIGALGTTMGVVKGFDIESRADGSSQALVATTFASEARVASVDLGTGVATTLSTVALAPGEWLNDVFALPPETDPAQARGELLAITEGKRLISFNRGAPGKLCTAQAISGLEQQEIVGADVRPADGALYVLARSGKLYTLATDTAVATFKSALYADPNDTSAPYAGLNGDGFGVGFNPVPDRLRVIGTSGQNLRVNASTGATTSDAPLNPGVPYVSALAYTNSFAGAKSTTLYALDSWTDALVRVGGNPASGGTCPEDASNPNCGAVTSLGSLATGGDVSHINAFDIDAVSGSAVAALSLGTSTTSALYSVDLSTGAAILPGAAIGGGERVVALVFAAAPSLQAYALTSDQRLLRFSPSNPGAPEQSLSLSGLAAGEQLLGLDQRPLDGQLYAVSNQARLVRVDAQSGAVSVVAPLSASGGGAITLPSATFGLDFNPAADALRLVASSGENYRILPSTRAAGPVGTTFVDGALNRTDGTPSVSAAGYTQNIAGTPSTTLYVIDGSTLAVQGGPNGSPSPNTGTVTTVGALGVTPYSGTTFDIVGANNGLALLVLSENGSDWSLHSVDLASGRATPFHAAGNVLATGGAAVTGLALLLK